METLKRSDKGLDNTPATGAAGVKKQNQKKTRATRFPLPQQRHKRRCRETERFRLHARPLVSQPRSGSHLQLYSNYYRGFKAAAVNPGPDPVERQCRDVVTPSPFLSPCKTRLYTSRNSRAATEFIGPRRATPPASRNFRFTLILAATDRRTGYDSARLPSPFQTRPRRSGNEAWPVTRSSRERSCSRKPVL